MNLKLLFDYIPVILFFITYKIWGIYPAIVVLMISSFLQLAILWLKYRKLETSNLITFAVIMVLGTASLLFRNPIFIIWKPTVVFWGFGIIFSGYKLIKKKTLLEIMLKKKITLDEKHWNFLNKLWIIFFAFIGALNLFIGYNFSLNIWVNFKLFGVLALTLIFIFSQSAYLSKHAKEQNVTDENKK
jgi:intracellular septation protein